jgi:hypothetical protein
VPIIRSWRLRDVIASCWYVPWLQGGCQVRLVGSASMDGFLRTHPWTHYLPREIKNTKRTSSWFLSTLNYDARPSTHQIYFSRYHLIYVLIKILEWNCMFFSFNDKSTTNIMTNAMHTVYILPCSVTVKIYWRKINDNCNMLLPVSSDFCTTCVHTCTCRTGLSNPFLGTKVHKHYCQLLRGSHC